MHGTLRNWLSSTLTYPPFVVAVLDLLAKLKTFPSNGTADAAADQGDGLHQRRRPAAPSSPKAERHEPEYTKEQLEIVNKIKK